MPEGPAEVRAAGGVLWRPAAGSGDGRVEIALVHRPRYDDWSLPKGKLARREHPLIGALREIQEETGSAAVAGRPLGTTHYPVLLHGRPVPKQVRWWAARATGGEFVPGAEVDEVTWVPPEQALDVVGPDGAAPLRTFLQRPAATRTVVLVRHGHAGNRGSWSGPDDLRPLDEAGRREAAGLAEVLACYRPQRVVSAPPLRCTDTVRPLADRLGVRLEVEPALSEVASDVPGALAEVLRHAACDGGAALCSQGGVLPALLAELLPGASGVAPPHRQGKGTAWVLSFADGPNGPQVVGAELWPAASH